jgi:hypothetical protein
MDASLQKLRRIDWVLVHCLGFMFDCVGINRKQLRGHNHGIFSIDRKDDTYANIPQCRADATVTVRVVGSP